MTIPSWLYTTRWLIFDIETTGLDPETDRVVQIAAVCVDGGAITHEWVALVNPGRPIPDAASAIHGITDELVSSAAPFSAIAERLEELARGRVLMGYNASRFDAPFVRAELQRAGRPVGTRIPVDPLVWLREIDRWVKGAGRHKLEVACRRWGVPVGRAHDALSDCRATWMLFAKLVEQEPDAFPQAWSLLIDTQTRMAKQQNEDFEAYLAQQRAKGA